MTLTKDDHNRLNGYYTNALKKHGINSSLALHWLTKRGQIIRFNILTTIAPLNGTSILDVGCGLGDFYDYLKPNVKNFSYHGIDILPEMIDHARIKYPDGLFTAQDIFSITKPYDYLMASGCFTFNISGGKEFYYSMVRHMYSLATKGVAFNLLEEKNYSTDKQFLSYNQNEIEMICKDITKNYKIISGYLEGDFTVYLYKKS